jgi:hypothetical protein
LWHRSLGSMAGGWNGAPWGTVSVLLLISATQQMQIWVEMGWYVPEYPPCNFPCRIYGLKATTKCVFIGHFVVRPPWKKVQGPLRLWQTMAFCRKNTRVHGWR